MKHLFIAIAFFIASIAIGQSITIETGLGFIEGISAGEASHEYNMDFKLGLRGLIPLDDNLEIFVAPYYLAAFGLDAGLWFNFPVTLESEEGFDSYAGLGLSYINNRIGLNLIAAISYELDNSSQIVLTYTHRPMFSPVLTQVFDLSLGYKILLD